MLAGRCSSKLSNHELQAKSKKSQAPSEAEESAVSPSQYRMLMEKFVLFIRSEPGFPARNAGRGRMCAFEQGKAHEVCQSRQVPREIREA